MRVQARRLADSSPYAGMNRIRFNGSIRMDVSGANAAPRKWR